MCCSNCGAKEQQFEKALAEALEISFQTTVAAPEAPRPASGGTQSAAGRGICGGARNVHGARTDVHHRDSGQSFNVEAGLFNQSPETSQWIESTVDASDGKNWNIRAPATHAREAARGQRGRSGVSRSLLRLDAALTRPYFIRARMKNSPFTI